MRIELNDGRYFQGTAKQIVQAMQASSPFAADHALREYVAEVARSAAEFECVTIAVEGDTDDELCAALVEALLSAGLAGKVV